jgi:predicted P-loop ATPase
MNSQAKPPDKPRIYNADLRHLPAALLPLTQEKRWVVWRLEWRANSKGGKWTKPPRQPANPEMYAKADDPSTWGDYAQALACVDTGRLDGIGIMLLTAEIAAGDLDHIRDLDTGELDPRAQAILDQVNGAYVEITVSGTGLRIIGTAHGPELHRRFSFDRKSGAGIELYRNTARYITVSGAELGGPCPALPPIDEVIDKLFSNLDGGMDFNSTGQENQEQTIDYDDIIRNGAPEGQRSEAFAQVVWHLLRCRWSVKQIVDELAGYPNGIAQKYVGRLHEEVERLAGKHRHRKGRAQAAQGRPPPAWLSQCATEAGRPLSNLANTMLAFELDPAVKDAFGFDEMACKSMLLRSPQGRTPRPVTDSDINDLQHWVQYAGLRKVTKATVQQVVDICAAKHTYHPIRDWLDDLRWDGGYRLDSWLTVYLGAEPNPYTSSVGAMFLISMVARIFAPGCKADHMIVLEGDQGTLKSTACKVLAGEAYFSDDLPPIESKDAKQHLAGKWLIEIAEMHAFTRAEINHLKSFITRTEEKYRRPWGDNDVAEKRQCIFIGTTNADSYLRDETGGRRFWPVKTGAIKAIDIEALKRDRDQLFAEAVNRYQAGAPWWPDRDLERQVIAREQAQRYDADAWADPIAVFLQPRVKVTLVEVGRDCLGIPIGKMTKSDQMRIASVLRNLQWKSKTNGHYRWWER